MSGDEVFEPRVNDSPMLRRVLGPLGPELTCDECFERLDEYVERELTTGDADERVPGMRAHLAGCPACGEDYASLRGLLDAEASGGGDSHGDRP